MCRMRLMKKLISVLLVLSVMLSLFVPFDLTVFSAEGDAARDDSIYAFVYKIDPSKGIDRNLELVFQNSSAQDPGRVLVFGPYSDFAGTCYHTKTYKYDSNSNITIDTQNQKNPASGEYVPWFANSSNGWHISKVTFKDKIAPTYITGWFYNCQNLSSIENIENLDMSYCEDMAYAFYNIANYDGNLEKLDLSSFDTSKVKQADYFIRSGNIQTVNLSGMDLKGIGGYYNIKKAER